MSIDLFGFVVRRLRWLARVPLLPQLFDTSMLAWTALVHRDRFRAMAALEPAALAIPGVGRRPHRFGGIGFVRAGREFAHLHGNGLLDVELTRERAQAVVESGGAEWHHVFGPSRWVSFWLRGSNDIPAAVALLTEAAAAHEAAETG